MIINATTITKTLLHYGYSWQDVEYYTRNQEEFKKLLIDSINQKEKKQQKELENKILLYFNNAKMGFIISYRPLQNNNLTLLFCNNKMKEIKKYINNNNYMGELLEVIL